MHPGGMVRPLWLLAVARLHGVRTRAATARRPGTRARRLLMALLDDGVQVALLLGRRLQLIAERRPLHLMLHQLQHRGGQQFERGYRAQADASTRRASRPKQTLFQGWVAPPGAGSRGHGACRRILSTPLSLLSLSIHSQVASALAGSLAGAGEGRAGAALCAAARALVPDGVSPPVGASGPAPSGRSLPPAAPPPPRARAAADERPTRPGARRGRGRERRRLGWAPSPPFPELPRSPHCSAHALARRRPRSRAAMRPLTRPAAASALRGGLRPRGHHRLGTSCPPPAQSAQPPTQQPRRRRRRPATPANKITTAPPRPARRGPRRARAA